MSVNKHVYFLVVSCCKDMKSRRSRSSATRGWKSPKSIIPRRSLKAKCGSRCFLDKKNLKFPICSPRSCKVSCKGVVAAKVRSAQWNYPEVYKKASRMVERRKCTKSSRKFRKSRKSRKVKKERA